MVKGETGFNVRMRQFLVTGARLPTERKPEQDVISMRIFAPNEVIARSKFWYQTKLLNRLKKANGEIVSCQEIHEKNTRIIKTYGVAIRYQSRSGQHNMYREYRDISLNGAVSQMYMEMSGKHRARHDTIQILRTCVVESKDACRRAVNQVYRNSKLRFPIVKFIARSTEKKYRSTFKANTPTTVKK
jgi:large subunit ribosomal protein L18Ae